jgi:hypothetical protein
MVRFPLQSLASHALHFRPSGTVKAYRIELTLLRLDRRPDKGTKIGGRGWFAGY